MAAPTARGAFRPSRLTLGCGGFGSSVPAADAEALVGLALDLGVSCFDTADAYGGGESERALGRALAARRGAATLVTKTGGTPPGGPPRARGVRRADLAPACEESLRRLRTDRVDLFLLHRFRAGEDEEELLGGLADLVRQGKALAYGVCNAEPEPLRGAASRPSPPAACQNEFSVAVRAAETGAGAVCRERGLAFMAYGPFASGHLLRERPLKGRFEGTDPALLARHRARLAEAARLFGVAPAAAALSWVLSRPWVTTAVLGASGPEQLRESAAGARALPELNRFLDEAPVPALELR